MRTLTPSRISAREYELFVARARSFDDLDSIVERIEDFRALDENQQAEIYQQCREYMIGGRGRSSLINTVALNRPYAFSALTLSKLFEKDGSGLKFSPGALRRYREFLHNYHTNHTFIEFETDEEWIAYFGDLKAQPTKALAMDYYMSKGDVQSAVALKKKEGGNYVALVFIEERDHLPHHHLCRVIPSSCCLVVAREASYLSSVC